MNITNNKYAIGRFSRLEAGLYIINVLASGKDDELSGLARGEFSVSARHLVRAWYRPRENMKGFFKEPEKEGRITRIRGCEEGGNASDAGSDHPATSVYTP